MPDIRQRLPAGRIHSENWDLKTAAKSPPGTFRMPSGALFSSSTPPCPPSRAPRNVLVPQSTATKRISVPAGPLGHAVHETFAGFDLAHQEELVGLMRLGDVARTADDGRHAERLPEDAGLGAVDDGADRIGTRPASGQRLGFLVAF